MRMYLIAYVTFLHALGITDFPVFGLLTMSGLSSVASSGACQFQTAAALKLKCVTWFSPVPASVNRTPLANADL